MITATLSPTGRSVSTPIVLCIDDDPEISGAIEMQMRRFDIKVVRAFHGMHGFAEAMRTGPDVIVMDLAMPSGDGGTILQWLRRNQQTSSIPVIILTGLRDPGLRRKLLRAGAEQVLRKPIRFDELLRELNRFIEIRERAHSDAT